MEKMNAAITATKAGAIATGGTTALVGWSVNEIASVIGATVAVLTLLMNFWFNMRRLKLEQSTRQRNEDRLDKTNADCSTSIKEEE